VFSFIGYLGQLVSPWNASYQNWINPQIDDRINRKTKAVSDEQSLSLLSLQGSKLLASRATVKYSTVLSLITQKNRTQLKIKHRFQLARSYRPAYIRTGIPFSTVKARLKTVRVATLVSIRLSVRDMDEWTIKTPNPKCRLFFKIDLLTDFAALCLTDFIDWRYIHSVVCIFRPSLWTVAPMDKGTIFVYCCPSSFSLTSHPSPLLNLNVLYSIYKQCVWLWEGGMLNCAVDHILQ
jgi:hypothetical protein